MGGGITQGLGAGMGSESCEQSGQKESLDEISYNNLDGSAYASSSAAGMGGRHGEQVALPPVYCSAQPCGPQAS